MIGAIIGDIVGSRFEWDSTKSKDFALFGVDGSSPACRVTDDSVMTVAVADALLKCGTFTVDALFKSVLIERMQYFGLARIDCGFGGHFHSWLIHRDTRPYKSYGNGSAMRVSPVGWYARSLEEAEHVAALTAEVTHNHPEGVKGAQAVAAAIWLARCGEPKDKIRSYIAENYYPDSLSRTLDEIRPDYTFDVSCQGSVPEALISFFESVSFVDAVRNAVSLGGDSDTQACIAGSIAEAYYGVPKAIQEKAMQYLDSEMRDVTLRFRKLYPGKDASNESAEG